VLQTLSGWRGWLEAPRRGRTLMSCFQIVLVVSFVGPRGMRVFHFVILRWLAMV